MGGRRGGTWACGVPGSPGSKGPEVAHRGVTVACPSQERGWVPRAGDSQTPVGALGGSWADGCSGRALSHWETRGQQSSPDGGHLMLRQVVPGTSIRVHGPSLCVHFVSTTKGSILVRTCRSPSEIRDGALSTAPYLDTGEGGPVTWCRGLHWEGFLTLSPVCLGAQPH